MQSVFSPSSLGCFENCPKQYSFRYIEKLEVASEGIEAFVGKRVHEILERLYRFVADGMLPSLERVLYRYQQNFEAEYDAEKVRIAREDTEAASYRAEGARGIENYYRRHYPFDADKTLGLEHPLQFTLDADGRYAVRGIIDRVVRAKDGALEIHDYKTARRVPRQQDLDKDRQLGLYEIGLRKLWNEAGPVRLVWHYVLSDQQRISERSEEQREALCAKTARAIDQIRAETAFAPKPSGLCGWCEYRAHCPAFAEERAQAAESATSPAQAAATLPAPSSDRDGQFRLL